MNAAKGSDTRAPIAMSAIQDGRPSAPAKRHRVVTAARGTTDDGRQGYAARCEDCDAITFGGNPSRSAARAQLTGHENAPGAAATALEGNNQNTPATGSEPIMTNPTDHAPYAHEDARNRTTAIGDEDARELEHAEWLEAHPEVSAALPSWCDEVTLAPDDAEHVALAIGREVGPFSLSVEGDYCEGRFSLGLYEVHAARTRLCAGSAESVAASARARALELLTIAYVLESEGAR